MYGLVATTTELKHYDSVYIHWCKEETHLLNLPSSLLLVIYVVDPLIFLQIFSGCRCVLLEQMDEESVWLEGFFKMMQSVILSQTVHGAKAVKRNKDLDISGLHEQVCLSDCCWQTCGSLRQWNAFFSSAVSFSTNFSHCQITLSQDRKTNNCPARWKRGQWGASHKRLSHSLRCHSRFHRAPLHTSLWCERHADISLHTSVYVYRSVQVRDSSPFKASF